MPTVPKMMDPTATNDPVGLMGDKDTQPDATSIMMAASLMRSAGKISKGSGSSPTSPHRAKAPKGSGRTKPTLR
jgi:hypothetical protein